VGAVNRSPITAEPQSIRQLGEKLQTCKVFSSLLAPLAPPSPQECGDDKRQVRKGDHAAKNLGWLDHVISHQAEATGTKIMNPSSKESFLSGAEWLQSYSYGGHPRIDPESGMLPLLCVDAFLRLWHTQPPGEPWMIATHLPGRGLLGTERVDLGHSEAGPFLSTHLRAALRGLVFGALCNVRV